MVITSDGLLLWTPRVLGVLVSLFIGMFALDAFAEGKSFGHAVLDFGIHLIPALVMLALVAVSFRWEWVGALAFIGCAVVYAATMARGRVDWMLAISGPLAIVGALFLWSWLSRGRLHAS
jgi:hypothetical protein